VEKRVLRAVVLISTSSGKQNEAISVGELSGASAADQNCPILGSPEECATKSPSEAAWGRLPAARFDWTPGWGRKISCIDGLFGEKVIQKSYDVAAEGLPSSERFQTFAVPTCCSLALSKSISYQNSRGLFLACRRRLVLTCNQKPKSVRER
jgi:hypothetical protein